MGYILSTLSSCFLCMGEYFTLKNEKHLKKLVKDEIKKNSPQKKCPHSCADQDLFEKIYPEINFISSKHVATNHKIHYNECMLHKPNSPINVNKYKLKLDYCD